MLQLPLFGRQVQAELRRTEHGGDGVRGRRKLERPVSTRRPMHVVMTSHRARGLWSLRKHDRTVRDVLRRMARRFDVRIYDFANVGSHLHLVLRARRRDAFQNFLRSFAGVLARRVTGAERGRRAGPFFSGLAWSRVVSWGRDYLGLRHYVSKSNRRRRGTWHSSGARTGPSASAESRPTTGAAIASAPVRSAHSRTPI